MIVTDAQIHVWAADTPERPWPPLAPDIRIQREEKPLEIDEVIDEMDAAGVDRAVIVPPGWDGERNDVVLAAAGRFPDRIAVMGLVDRSNPSSADVGHWREQPGMLGIRMSFSSVQPISEADWLWPLAARSNIPVTIRAPGRLDQIGDVARNNPDLRLVVDHLGLQMSAIKAAGYPDIGPMLAPLVGLSALDNVAVKVSALPNAIDEDFPFSSLGPHVRRVMDAFGAARCMWGSDLSQLKCPYAEWVDAAKTGFGQLSENEIELLMGGTLSHWFDWPQVLSSR